MYRRCQYLLRDDADAQDAMHEVFIKALESYDDFLGTASPLTWLVRITTNHCLNVLRAKRAKWKERYEATVKVDLQNRPPTESARLEQQQLVRTLLHKCDREVQAAAVYYFVDEMSQEEAAQAAECSVPTLRKRLREFVRVAQKELTKMDATITFEEESV